MSRFGYPSTPTPTPTDSWSSYFDSWRYEDKEMAAYEPVILDHYDDLHPDSLQVKFNNANFDLDWEMDYLQDGCSPLPPLLSSGSVATRRRLDDAYWRPSRQGQRQGHDLNDDGRVACRVCRGPNDVDMGMQTAAEMDMKIDETGMDLDLDRDIKCQYHQCPWPTLPVPRQRQRQPRTAAWLGDTGTSTNFKLNSRTSGSNFGNTAAPGTRTSAAAGTGTASGTAARSQRRARASSSAAPPTGVIVSAVPAAPAAPARSLLIGDLAWTPTLDQARTGTDLPANHNAVSGIPAPFPSQWLFPP
ncbi:hypothetical protein ABEF95_015832 [Exophiala dermatitidis]